jgi:uncharacterized RDD family membrane protein YckC
MIIPPGPPCRLETLVPSRVVSAWICEECIWFGLIYRVRLYLKGMYCHKCGAQVDDQAAFCDKCGKAIGGASPDVITTLTGQTVLYAGWQKRIGACFIDGAIFTVMEIVGIIILSVLGLSNVGDASAESDSAALANLVFALVFFAAYWAYFAIMESSSRQATLGKMAMGIVVTDYNGKRVSLGRALGRNLGKLISGLILYIGYFMIAFTEKKQGFHDMLAGCLVVVKK